MTSVKRTLYILVVLLAAFLATGCTLSAQLDIRLDPLPLTLPEAS